jgi:hypothetical protein
MKPAKGTAMKPTKNVLARRASRITALAIAVASAFTPCARADEHNAHGHVQHVLLISVDGMHQIDLQRYVAGHPASAFARLLRHGVEYRHASSSTPSDSFPGLLAFMTGGSPRSHGVFYDDSYDRTLYAPGTNCQGPVGSEAAFAENLDYDLTALDGGGAAGSNHIDPANLPLRLVKGQCVPVYPHDFLKTNTVMEVIHASGRRTAWTDKHPAYEIVSGPSGKGLDELFAPEINSTSIPGNASDDWTKDPVNTRTYDGFKVAGVLNQIRGYDHTGVKYVGVPAMFGMNFQAVSVSQKITADGYLDAAGTPSVQLALSLDAVDHALGQMLDTLTSEHLLDSTLVIVGAKHGQSPIDVTKLHMISSKSHPNPKATLDVTDPVDVLANGGVTVAQETADDVALIWLRDQSQLGNAVSALQADQAGSNSARIQKIYAGAELVARFGNPAQGRTPDIIIQPVPGTIYSGSAAKISEHGGFATDDTHVLLIVSNPALQAKVVDAPVTNMQVAPTILDALGLNPEALQAVRREHTRELPGLESRER